MWRDASPYGPERVRTVLVGLPQVLDLFAENSRLNVYAGELEVRPPAAPTTKRGSHEREPDDLSQSFS